MSRWHRGRKSKAQQDHQAAPEDADAAVRLDGAEHAWWASRDELKFAWTPPKKKGAKAPSDDPQTSSFQSRYSAESLFNWAGNDKPDDPTYGGGGVLLDPYAVLGLEPGASIDEVTSAHRQLAKRYHPDRHFSASEQDRSDAEKRMSGINAAYHELRSRRLGP